ncbi:MAG: rod shape-determining protein [Pirellulales bacterium]
MLNRLFGFLGSDLAVDLGTVNTRISVPGQGLVLDEPSVVAVEQSGRRVFAEGCAVGHLASQMLGRAPGTISVVRPMREGVIYDFELAEAMLRYFLRKAQGGGWRFGPRVMITVPGSISPVEKRAVFNSGLRAGARQVLLLPQHKAAAIGVGLPIAEPVASMVCDIGGGTTEAAVMSLNDLVSSHSIRVGGDQMNGALIEYLKRNYQLRVGAAGAERLRIELGSAFTLETEITDEVSGVDQISGLPRKASITSEEVREALAEPLHAIVVAIKETIDGCSPDLASDLVENGLVLTGGGALLRRMDRFVSEQTGLPCRVSDSPLEDVARGSQICLEQLPRWRDAVESSDDDVPVRPAI